VNDGLFVRRELFVTLGSRRCDLEVTAMRTTIQIVIKVSVASILFGIAAIITALR